MNHTPTLLQIRRESDNQGYTGIVLITPDGRAIANMVMQLDDTERANAQSIVTACNAHEELVEIARAYRNFLKMSAHTDGEVATYHHINDLLATIEKGA